MTASFGSSVLALVIIAAQNVARADSEARYWLERISMASQSLNYSGIFVYQREGNLDAMQIVHASDESGER